VKWSELRSDVKWKVRRLALHVKKGDMVEIIAGDHKGATGRVLRVIPEKNKVIVQGHNVAQKHVRPSRKNPQGGRISVEQPIHISNVLPVRSKSSKGTRVRYTVDEAGSKKRIAVDGTEISIIRKSR
jgi:large subunit ribosomal protein L24